MHTQNYRLGYLVLRITLGLNIFLHGAFRFGGNYNGFVSGTTAMFTNTPLPEFVVESFIRAIPITECLVGALLLAGLFTRVALMLGSLLLLCLMTGMSVLQSWETVGLQMIYMGFYVVLLYRLEDNSWALDRARLFRRLAIGMAEERE